MNLQINYSYYLRDDKFINNLTNFLKNQGAHLSSPQVGQTIVINVQKGDDFYLISYYLKISNFEHVWINEIDLLDVPF